MVQDIARVAPLPIEFASFGPIMVALTMTPVGLRWPGPGSAAPWNGAGAPAALQIASHRLSSVACACARGSHTKAIIAPSSATATTAPTLQVNQRLVSEKILSLLMAALPPAPPAPRSARAASAG